MTFRDALAGGEYVLIAEAVIFVAVVIIWWARGVKVSKGSKSYGGLMQRLRDNVMEGDIENAIQLCDSVSNPGAYVVGAGVRRIGAPMPEIREAMHEASELEYQKMQKGAGWLRTLAVIAPLAGLGGTLVGIIDKLQDLASQGAAADMARLCGETAPTIITTVAGLGTGIFALIAFACLEGRINKSRTRLQKLAMEFTDLLNEPS